MVGDVVYKLLATLSLDNTEFIDGMNDSRNAVTGSGIPQAAKTVGRAANVAFAAAGAGAIAFTKAALSAGVEFDSAMSRVKAISGANADEFEDLREKALYMGRTTKFTATEAAEALNYMAMAGWKTDEMLAGLEGIMNLAAAGGEELGTTSDIVTDALTAFKLSAADAGHFADVLAAASSNSNTNISMMGETFKYVAPVAGTLGYNIEDTAIAIGLMANSGIKASMAGTSLRSFLTRLAKPTKESAAAMEALGISLDDGEGNMLSLMDVMKELRSGFNEGLMISADELNASIADLNEQLDKGAMSQEEYDSEMESLTQRAYGAKAAVMAQFAAMLGGQRAMSGLLAIVNATDKDFADLTESIYGAAGATETMKNIMLDNLGGDVTLLQSAWSGFLIQFSDKLAPEIRKVVPRITEAITKLTDKVANMDFSKLADGIATVAEKALGLIEYLLEHSDEVIEFVGNITKLFLAGKGVSIGGKVVKGTAEIGGWLGGLFGFGGGGGAAAASTVSAGAVAGTAAAAALPLALGGGMVMGVRDYVHAYKEAVDAATMDSDASLEALAENLETQKQLLAEAKERYAKAEESELWASLSGEVNGELAKATAELDAAEAACKAAQEQYDAALLAVQENATSAESTVSTTLSGLSESAEGWGTDMMISFANGINAGTTTYLSPAISGAADLMWSMLHHSEPETGPLAHDSEWMPDMMRGFAQGIREGTPEVQEALNDAFDVHPAVGLGAGVAGRTINFSPTINVNGANYKNDQDLAERIAFELKHLFDREAAAYA